MRLWSAVVVRTLFCCAVLLLVACTSNGSGKFEQLALQYVGCAMTPPWPVELNSADADGATFVRTDDVESSPFYFSRSESPSWEMLPNVVPESIEYFEHPYFTIAQFREFYSDDSIEFSRQATVIRRAEFELFLPGEMGSYWRDLVESCSDSDRSESERH